MSVLPADPVCLTSPNAAATEGLEQAHPSVCKVPHSPKLDLYLAARRTPGGCMGKSSKCELSRRKKPERSVVKNTPPEISRGHLTLIAPLAETRHQSNAPGYRKPTASRKTCARDDA